MIRFHCPVRRVSFAAIVGAIVASQIGCVGPYRPRSRQKIIGSGLVAVYDSNRDRLVRFGPRGFNTNSLYVNDLDRDPSPSGQYTYFGGMYSWVAPQSGWTDERGQPQPWPPPFKMDVGPMLVTRHALNEFEAVGPVLESGLQEVKSVQLGRDTYGARALVTNGLKNTTDEPQWGGVWLSTAAIPGSVIAFITPDEDHPIQLSDHPNAQQTWDNVTRQRSRWTLVRTKRYYWWLERGSTFKATVPSDRVIAIHRRGRWFVRIGEPWTPESDTTLTEAGEGPVEVAVNFGAQMHEAALLGPIEEIAPGETTQYRERWYMISGAASRVRQLDEMLYQIDPVRFPLPPYLQDDDSDLEQWLDEDADEAAPAPPPAQPPEAKAPPAEKPGNADAPPIDIDDVEDK